MWKRLLCLIVGTPLIGIFCIAPQASAVGCSAARPAQLTFRDKPEERVIQVDSNKPPQSVAQYEIVIRGCTLSPGEKSARVIGLVQETGVSVSLEVAPNGRAATLLVDLSKNSLGPRTYSITAISTDPAVNLYHPVTINVRDSRWVPWATIALLGVLVGLAVLALRATASGEGPRHWNDFVQFFKQPESLVPALFGIAGVWVALESRVFSNETWYGQTVDLAKLAGVIVTAMVTAGTAATAASRKAATVSA
jgi:hypothetical protein